MSFANSTLDLAVQTLGGGNIRIHFLTTSDSEATVTAADYITNARKRGVKAGDLVIVYQDGGTDGVYVASVSAISTAGHGTLAIDRNLIQEYATRAALAATSVAPTINVVRLQGYYAAGDLGGFTAKRVVSEPSHAGKVQSADGAWWEMCEVEPNARMFGARGDGSTDDTAALQAAFSAVDVCGRYSLLIPAGRYKTTAPIVHQTTKQVRIRGEGKSLTFLEPTIAIGASGVLNLRGDLVSAQAYVLQDFCIRGVEGAAAGAAPTGIYCTTMNGCRFERIAFGVWGESTRYLERGIHLTLGSAAGIITECAFHHVHHWGIFNYSETEDSYGGVYDWSGNKMQILYNYFYDCGIGSNGGGARLFQGISAVFKGNDLTTNRIGFELVAADGTLLIGNYFELSKLQHIKFTPGVLGHFSKHVIVEGNVFGMSPCADNFLHQPASATPATWEYIQGLRYSHNYHYRCGIKFSATTTIDVDVGPNTFDGFAAVSITGDRTNGSAVLTNVVGAANIITSQLITGTGIPSGTRVLSVNTGAATVTMSAAATSSATGATYTQPADVVGLVGANPWNAIAAYLNAWTTGPGFEVPGYRKKSDGTIELKGVLTPGSVGSVAFTLPAGYRPLNATKYIGAVDANTGAQCMISLGTNGNVVPVTCPGVALSLDGVRFTTD